jgi:nucleoside-diphosphate-sugar epimerase
VTVLITGVSGFTGKAISRHLISEGHEVVGLSRTNPNVEGLHFIQADLTNAASLPSEFRSDTVIHCAALTKDGRGQQFTDINYGGTLNALNLNPEGKFIHLSSSSIYNMVKDSLFIEEDEFSATAYKFYNDYSRTKAEAENHLLNSSSSRTVAPISLRPHAIYGEHDTTLLPRLMKRIKNHSILLPNAGNVRHTLTNINNLVQAIDKAMITSFPTVQAFNITDSNDILMKDAVRIAASDANLTVSGVPTKALLGFAGRPTGVSEYEARQLGFTRTYSIQKAVQLLGYQPTPFHMEWLGGSNPAVDNPAS